MKDLVNLKKSGKNMAAAMTVIGLLQLLVFNKSHAAVILFSLAAYVLICLLVFPLGIYPLHLLVLAIAKIITLIGKVTMVLFYYLIFTPFAFILRVFGKVKLEDRIEKDRTSYWIKKDNTNVSQYEKQW